MLWTRDSLNSDMSAAQVRFQVVSTTGDILPPGCLKEKAPLGEDELGWVSRAENTPSKARERRSWYWKERHVGPTVLTALGCASNLGTRKNKEQQQQQQKQKPGLGPVHPRKPGCSLSAYIVKSPTEASTSQEPDDRHLIQCLGF